MRLDFCFDICMAAYVPFYSNKVKDKEEKQVTHTYALRQVKIFMEAAK